LSAYEPEVSTALAQTLEREGITILTRSEVVAAGQDHDGISVAVKGNPSTKLRSSHLLVATGRVPNSQDLNLEEVGVGVDERGAIVVDEELRTTTAHVWAAGDVSGVNLENQMATPVGAQDGGIAALNALADEHLKVDHRVIPRAIFTDPEVAVVGLTEKHAVERRYRSPAAQ
jgi:mercuric reductase